MEEKEKKKNNKWTIILIIILIILGLIAFLIWHLDSPKKPVKEGIKTEQVPESAGEGQTASDDQSTHTKMIDEASGDKHSPENKVYADSTTPNPNRKPEFAGEYMFDKKFDFKLVDFMQANYRDMKLITYGTPREVELEEGKRLTLIARDYYGNKQFWVYIYLYNTDIIKDPDHIPAGLVIKVPRLDRSLADPNNQACIDAAWDVQKYLLKM